MILGVLVFDIPSVLYFFLQSVAQSASNSKKGRRQPNRMTQPAVYDIDTIDSRYLFNALWFKYHAKVLIQSYINK